MRRLALAAALLAAGCAGPRTAVYPFGVCGRTKFPQPVVSRTWLAFFDAGSAVLTERARRIIAELASNRAGSGGEGLIVIEANLDGAEAQTTAGLDLRRAEAARDELVRDGVPAKALAMAPNGFTQPLVLVQGAEAQNRRIVFLLLGFGASEAGRQRDSCLAWFRTACLAPHPAGDPDACEAALRFVLR